MITANKKCCRASSPPITAKKLPKKGSPTHHHSQHEVTPCMAKALASMASNWGKLRPLGCPSTLPPCIGDERRSPEQRERGERHENRQSTTASRRVVHREAVDQNETAEREEQRVRRRPRKEIPAHVALRRKAALGNFAFCPRTTAFACRAGCKERDVSKNRHAGPVKCNALLSRRCQQSIAGAQTPKQRPNRVRRSIARPRPTPLSRWRNPSPRRSVWGRRRPPWRRVTPATPIGKRS